MLQRESPGLPILVEPQNPIQLWNTFLFRNCSLIQYYIQMTCRGNSSKCELYMITQQMNWENSKEKGKWENSISLMIFCFHFVIYNLFTLIILFIYNYLLAFYTTLQHPTLPTARLSVSLLPEHLNLESRHRAWTYTETTLWASCAKFTNQVMTAGCSTKNSYIPRALCQCQSKKWKGNQFCGSKVVWKLSSSWLSI